MPDPDLPSAARRVAEDIRRGTWPADDDARALLPALDALAAGAGADRVERMARGLCAAAGHADPDQPYAGGVLWEKWAPTARSAIALAAAERAAEADAAYEWMRGLYEATGGATPALRDAYAAYKAWEVESTAST